MKKDRLKPLRKIADALIYADKARLLLDDIWMWYGPYGRQQIDAKTIKRIQADPELLKAWAATQLPDELHQRLRDFFNFDDSE